MSFVLAQLFGNIINGLPVLAFYLTKIRKWLLLLHEIFEIIADIRRVMPVRPQDIWLRPLQLLKRPLQISLRPQLTPLRPVQLLMRPTLMLKRQ